MVCADKFYFTEINKVPVFKSGNILSPHAFSTRLGGVSTETHLASLNLCYRRGDSDENVEKNLEIFAGVIGTARDRLVTASQTHSVNIKKVTEEDAGKNFSDTDGFVTCEKNIAISVAVADCTPVLLEDTENGVIAALHAGWRGTVAGIACKGVESMLALGADVKNIKVAIGQCIHSCCYEVGEDFTREVARLAGKTFAARHIKKDESGRFFANISSMNEEILLECSILPENISISQRCTACESDLFFSHRASKGMRGGMRAAIML